MNAHPCPPMHVLAHCAARWGRISTAVLLGAAFVCAPAVAAAEREVLTLTDGRTLTGVYDAAAGTVALDGKAVVKVRAEQVKTRAPAAPVVAAIETPKPAREALPSMAAVVAQAEQIRQESDARIAALYKRWLQSADLTPLTVPKMAADPLASEAKRAQEITAINDILLRNLQHDLSTDANLGTLTAVLSYKPNQDLWDRLQVIRKAQADARQIPPGAPTPAP